MSGAAAGAGPMNVAEAVGRALAALGADTVFGVVGSGNFHVTNALAAAGARFVAARHEGGATTMADAWARVTGRPGIVTVHQGPGLTNAMTGIAEAAKSRTPLIVVTGETAGAAVLSNFRVDQAALAVAVGATPERVHSPASVVDDVVRAYRTAAGQRRTVVLGLPLDVQAMPVPDDLAQSLRMTASLRTDSREREGDALAMRVDVSGGLGVEMPRLTAAGPSAEGVAALADVLAAARRPVFVAGRGGRRAREPLRALAERCGALLATSAVARGLFRGDPYDLDVSGGFATPLAAELIRGADVIVGWGCALNMWTMRHGALIGPEATVVQVDVEPAALGAHRPIDLGILGDTAATATAVEAELAARGGGGSGYRMPGIAERIAAEGRWGQVPYEDAGDGERIDPRTLSRAIDEMLPPDRVIGVDSGNFMGHPAMYLEVPDKNGLIFTQAYQSIGLGLATAIGGAVALPDRLPIAALGDGGALMSIADLETAVRLKLGMLVLIYDDEAYGAEVHHFGPGGHPLDTVTFPPADIAEIARGFGCDGAVVRRTEDLGTLRKWLDGPRDRPFVLDAKITPGPSWWLEEAFRGH